MPPSLLDVAGGYVAAGLSVIPVRPDGTKSPAVAAWKQYMRRTPTEEELREWFAEPGSGIAIVCGAVSGNLEVLDFEAVELFDAWEADLLARRSPLLGKLPIVATPKPGRHVYYRLPFPPEGSRKLARRPPTPEERAANPKCRAVTLVETKGEGGYVLAPGCPAACHPSGKLYRHIGGPPLTHVPTLEGRIL